MPQLFIFVFNINIVYKIQIFYKGVQINHNMKIFLRLLTLYPFCLFCCFSVNLINSIVYQIIQDDYSIDDVIGYSLYVL